MQPNRYRVALRVVIVRHPIWLRRLAAQLSAPVGAVVVEDLREANANACVTRVADSSRSISSSHSRGVGTVAVAAVLEVALAVKAAQLLANAATAPPFTALVAVPMGGFRVQAALGSRMARAPLPSLECHCDMIDLAKLLRCSRRSSSLGRQVPTLRLRLRGTRRILGASHVPPRSGWCRIHHIHY